MLKYIDIKWISDRAASSSSEADENKVGEHTASDLAGFYYSKGYKGFKGFMKNNEIYSRIKEILKDGEAAK